MTIDLAPWFLGTEAAGDLAAQMGVPLALVPTEVFDEAWSPGSDLEAWREGEVNGERYDVVVVALLAPDLVAHSLAELTDDDWYAQCEGPFAQWFAALTVATERCNDRGVVIAFCDRPVPKDSGNWALTACVSDGVELMVRSLALIHEARGVRVHFVGTPARIEGKSHAQTALHDRFLMLVSGDAASMPSTVLYEGEM